MKVILRENVPNLGKIGDIVKVSDGYGLNFLLPRKLAIIANERNMRELEHHKRVTSLRLERARTEAKGLVSRLDGLRITVRKHAGEEGKLFGSVTTREVADLLGDQGFEVDRRNVDLPEGVKQLGEYAVDVTLLDDIKATVTLVVESVEPVEAADA
jgi:large subunit ribosomal protein L9